MSKMGQAAASLMWDDMGEPSEDAKAMREYSEAEQQAAQRQWELSKFTTVELQVELARRGYVNGVLVHPELDPDLKDEE